MAYEELIEKLRKKGWSNRDIVATIQIMEKIQQEEKLKRTGWLYWLALILIIVGMTIVSIVLVPLIFTLNVAATYFIMVIVAYSFGTMFSIVLQDLEEIQGKKIIIPILIPGIGIVNMYYVIKASEILLPNRNIPNPLVMSSVYALLFMAPYFFSKLASMIKVQ